MVRSAFVGCLLLQLAATARSAPPAVSEVAPAASPRPVATPLTLLVTPGQADVKMIVGVPGPGQQEGIKLWSDRVVRALLRAGFTLVDDPKQKHDADLKLAIAINPQRNLANITVTLEAQGQIVDVIEDLNRARWNNDGAANGLANRIKTSGALVAFAQKRRGPSNLEKAKQLHESATKKFDLGLFADAVKDWTRAYQLDPRAQFLYNIGNSYYRKGEIEHNAEDLRRAEHFYNRFAENDPNADVKAELRETNALLKKLEGRP
jgi:tetratricopeptide (TPR) repeat protein